MAMNPESGYTTFAQRNKGDVSNSVGYAPIAPPPNCAPPKSANPLTVGEELKYLDNELGTLFQFIDNLERRLEAVLTPPAPDSDGSGNLSPFGSPLLVKLTDQAGLLCTANRRLAGLLTRIEL